VQFSIVTPLPIVMRAGMEIDYRLRLHGVPLAWTSRVDVWEPNHRFVDRRLPVRTYGGATSTALRRTPAPRV
jgi:hypothetical protein